MKKFVKDFVEKIKKVNLTVPLLAVVVGLVVVITYLLNYYGIINVAGLKKQNKETVKTEQQTLVEPEKPKEEPRIETPAPTPAPVPTVINLSGSAYATGVKLTWSVSGVDTSKGFKVVKSTSQNPVYPGNDYAYLSNSGARSYAWEIKDGKTYYFRVCQYLGGSCGVYSNNIKVTAPFVATTTPSAVNGITARQVGETVSWIVNGYSEKGFKVVWAPTSEPTYPPKADGFWQYWSDPATTTSDSLRIDHGGKTVTPGTYFVRVCEYLGGSCGVYSNQITVTLP